MIFSNLSNMYKIIVRTDGGFGKEVWKCVGVTVSQFAVWAHRNVMFFWCFHIKMDMGCYKFMFFVFKTWLSTHVHYQHNLWRSKMMKVIYKTSFSWFWWNVMSQTQFSNMIHYMIWLLGSLGSFKIFAKSMCSQIMGVCGDGKFRKNHQKQ